MRVSVHKNHPDYDPKCHMYNVYLNGKKVPCFFADEEKGEIHCYRKDSKGHILLNESRTEPLTEILRGRVNIIDKQ